MKHKNQHYIKVKYLVNLALVVFLIGFSTVSVSAGLTIITHGYIIGQELPQWVRNMANEVNTRLDVSHPIYRLQYDKEGLGKEDDKIYLRDGDINIDTSSTGGAIIMLDWASLSDEVLQYKTQEVADKFYEYLFENNSSPIENKLEEIPIHLIGHSRGASLNSRIAERLAKKGIIIEQVTTLDPHPVTGTTADDVLPTTYINTIYADNYYQIGDGLHDFEGRPVYGAADHVLAGIFEEDEEGLACVAHSLVHTYYLGTVNPDQESDGTCDINEEWYGSDFLRRKTGFNYNRSANYHQRGLHEGYWIGLVDKNGHSYGVGKREGVELLSERFPNAGFIQDWRFQKRYEVGVPADIEYYFSDRNSGGNSLQRVELFLDDNKNPYDNENNDKFRIITNATHSTGTGIVIRSSSVSWIPELGDTEGGIRYIGLKTTNDALSTEYVRYDYIPESIIIDQQPIVPPVVASVSPRVLSGLPLPETQTLTINGTGFTADSLLTFDDGINAPYEGRVPIFDSSTQLRYDLAVDVDAGNWTVTVVNEDADSEPYTFYVEQAFLVPPKLSIPPIASDGTYTDEISLDWASVADADTYEVYRCANTVLNSCDWIASTALHSYQDNSVPNDSTQYYRVKACNSNGCSVYSDYDPGYQGTSQIPTPSWVEASDGVYTAAILIDWPPVSGAAIYDVYRSTSLTGSKITVANATELSLYADTKVTAGRTYYYWVRACDSRDVCSGLSAPDSGYKGSAISIPSQANLPQPEDGSVSVTNNLEEVSWSNGGGAQKYEVYFGTNPTPGASERLGFEGRTRTSIPDLAYDTTYYWRIDSIYGDQTVPGEVWSFTTRSQSAGQLPARVTMPLPLHESHSVPVSGTLLQWAPSARATSYDVYFGRQFQPDQSEYQGNTTSTSWQTPPLEYGKIYYWKIKARNAAGTAHGDIWKFRVEPPAPSNAIWPRPANGENNVRTSSLSLSWTDIGDSTNFDVYFGTSPTLGAGDLLGDTEFSRWEIAALQKNTTYYWKVVSKNNAGSSTGDVWSFTTWAQNPGTISVSAGGFSSRRNLDDDFFTTAKHYTVKNTGESAVDLSINAARNWTALSTQSENLQPGQEIIITASIGPEADSLSSGFYWDSLQFTNTTNGYGNTTRSVGLAIDVENQPYDVKTLSMGLQNAVAIKSNGALYIWGDNSEGQLGQGAGSQPLSPNPISVESSLGWVDIDISWKHAIAVREDGRLFAWGNNQYGQLGLGDTASRSTPTQVGVENDWQKVAVGLSHSFALKEDGRLFAFGSNYEGRLGVGDTTNRYQPVQVGNDSDWVTVIPAGLSTLAIKRDGRLFTWGSDAGSDGSSIVSPIQVEHLSDWMTADGGLNHDFLAIRQNGMLYLKERRYSNSTGDIMIRIGNDSDWKDVAVGDSHFMALKSDGRLYAWGDNQLGELGLGDRVERTSPVLVMQDPNIESIHADGYSSFAVMKDGRVLAWGNNYRGNLGIGHTEERVLAPTEVDLDWAVIENSVPIIVVATPFDGSTVVTSYVNSTGSAADADGNITDVQYRLNAGEWQFATGTTAWSLQVNGLLVGANTIQVRSRDDRGAFSTLETLSVTRLADTDGDGIPDIVDTDDDNDGLSDFAEGVLGTDPLNADSDGDGDSDGDEVAYGTDPKLISDSLDDHRPVTPVLDSYPGNIPLAGLTLTATPFQDPDLGSFLLADQWQFSWDSGFTQLFMDRSRATTETMDDGATLLVPDGLLEPGSSEFWARLRHSDNLGLWSYWSDPVMFSIPDTDPNDLNQDGRPDADEVNGYTDLDDDGQDDSTRVPPMLRVEDAVQGSTVGVVLANAPAGSTLLTVAPVIPHQIPEDVRPPTSLVPYGLFSFTVTLPQSYVLDPENPETITVEFYFEQQIPPGTQWIKFDPVTGSVLDVTDDVIVNGNMASIAITDGGSGDFDGLVNGYYVDPVGPLFPDADADEDTIHDSQDNCTYRVNLNQEDRGSVNSSDPDGIGDACQCGDQNADGMVTNTDAVLIQRHLLGLPSPFSADLCDVNGDGNCSNTDAVIIKRAVLGLPPGVVQGCAAAVPVQ